MSSSVRIVGREKPVVVEEGSTLLDVVRAAGFSVAADCGGAGKCGRCRIKVVEGASRVPPSEAEVRRIGAKEVEAGFRFACCHGVSDGLVLDVVEEMYRQEVYKRLGIGIGTPLPLCVSFRKVPLSDESIDDSLKHAGVADKVDWVAVLPDALEPGNPGRAPHTEVSSSGRMAI
jgi:ferredoxin